MFRSLLFAVVFPNVALVGLKSAPFQFGWLKASNASARNWKPFVSVTANFLYRPTFQFWKPGLWMRLRTFGCILNVPFAGAVNIGEPSGFVIENHCAGSLAPFAANWCTTVGSPLMTQNCPAPPQLSQLPSCPTPA